MAGCWLATMLGLTEVPVIRLSHLDEAERRAYRIADNKLTEMGEWDEALLRDEIAGLLAEDSSSRGPRGSLADHARRGIGGRGPAMVPFSGAFFRANPACLGKRTSSVPSPARPLRYWSERMSIAPRLGTWDLD